MKVLRGTLTFVLGIIIGIILFVVAIGGTVVAIFSAVSLGDLQQKFNVNIIQEDSEAYNKSMLDVTKDLIQDIKTFDRLSLKDIVNKYGVAIPTTIAGIDISEAFNYPIVDISNHVDSIINSISLEEIGNAAGINWDDMNLPIVKKHLDEGASDAINAILQSIDSNMSIQDIKADFGIDLGAENNTILDKLQFIPLSAIGETINYIELNDVVKADTDTFIAKESVPYFKVDEYVEISNSDLANASYKPAIGIETYVAGVKDLNNDGKNDSLFEREMRFVQNEQNEYVIDNSSYSVDFDASKDHPKYYRHIQYKPCNGKSGSEYYIPAYGNYFNKDLGSLYFKGFVKAETNPIAQINNPVANKIAAFPQESGIKTDDYYDLKTPLANGSKLEIVGATGSYVKYSNGTSSSTIDAIAYKTIYDLQNDSDFINDLTLGEILTIDESSSLVMQSLKDTKVNEMSSAIDDLYLYQIMSITMDEYTKDENGLYVKINVADAYYYTTYNPVLHNSAIYERYTKSPVADSSSKVLQRLRTAKIGTFSDDFKSLLLSDVLDITPNIYDKITYASPAELPLGVDYYYYDSAQGLYLLANDDYIASHDNVYKVAKLGEGSKVLRRLAYVKVDDLSAAMETVIDDMFISDVIDIIDYYAIEVEKDTLGDLKPFVGTPQTDDKFFIPYTEQIGDDYITYIYNANGKYIKRDYEITGVDNSLLTENGSKKIKFKQVDSKTDALTNIQSLFYSADGLNFSYNPGLTTYIANKSSYDPTVDNAKLYYPIEDVSGVEFKTYSDVNLYVLVFGSYVPYDNSNPFHIALNEYYQKSSTGSYFVNIQDPTPSDDSNYKYNESSDILLSRVYCEKIYIANDLGDYVYYDNSYVLYDVNNTEHQTLQRYNVEYGYIGDVSNVFYKDSLDHYLSSLSFSKILNINNDKSANVLTMLKNSKTTIKNMSASIDSAQLKDLMIIDPDSIFAVEFLNKNGVLTSLQNSNIKEMGSDLSAFMSSIKMGDLLNIASIKNISPQVKEIIKNVTISQFFKSLEFNPTLGTVVLNLEVLYAD